MSEYTFAKAKVGDRVFWFTRRLWGTITSVDSHVCNGFPIGVRFDDGGLKFFSSGGHYTWDEGRTLFWDEFEYQTPERPKRKVKKTYYVNVYKGIGGGYWTGSITDIQQTAIHRGTINERIFVKTLEFELEEDE